MTVGFSIAHHLCGDYVVVVAFNSMNTANEPEDCCTEPCSDDCCKTEIKIVKIDDIQSPVAKWELNSYTIEILLPQKDFYISSQSTFLICSEINNSPPGNKTHIINQTFLI